MTGKPPLCFHLEPSRQKILDRCKHKPSKVHQENADCEHELERQRVSALKQKREQLVQRRSMFLFGTHEEKRRLAATQRAALDEMLKSASEKKKRERQLDRILNEEMQERLKSEELAEVELEASRREYLAHLKEVNMSLEDKRKRFAAERKVLEDLETMLDFGKFESRFGTNAL